jgi:hypothetical protein
MRKLYKLFILSLLYFSPAHAQILINEVCSAGDTALKDEDGTVQDWIEFYNAGLTTVNLAGYKIKCIQDNKTKSWTFPQVYILPQQHLTVFFSGKNRKDYFNHWEIPVYPQVNWRYFPGTSEPPSNWNTSGFNDASWALGSGPIGYGDGDDTTIIAPVISMYQRYSFTIADTSKIILAAVLIDYDDGFVAYLNGKEIGRANVGAQGYPPSHSDFAFDEHESQMYQNGGWSGLFYVPSTMLDTIIHQGVNTFALQTHNSINGMDDMTQIPALLIGVVDTSVTYFPFAADVHLHTDYQLYAPGAELTLLDAQGNIADHQIIGPIMLNHSRGRQPDGSSNWCLFNSPTPDISNFSSACYSNYGPTPVISLASGFYAGTQVTGITASAPGVLKWTYDGSDPGIFSANYSGNISLNNTQVIRARLFPSDTLYLPGPTAAASYFINEDVTLPVVSITTDPLNLFDPNYGIYVLGNISDTNISNIPFYDANFWQGWERPANVSYFDKNNQLQFEEPVSIKIQGNWSKLFPQRSFTVTCDENYGGSPVNYQLFPDKPATAYLNFNVRNAGSDWGGCHYRDLFLEKSIQKSTSLDMMDGFACVMFINGQYWGVYEMREKEDKHFIANNSTCDDDNTDFLEFDGSVIEGDNKSFFKMHDYIMNANINSAAAYDSVNAMLDIKNFCDYFITETYAGNQDWLGTYTNNIKFWKPHTGPGKWRYILWDTDITFQSDTFNVLSQVINPPAANPHSDMLRTLLQNDSFRIYFINRYADLLNTTFYSNNMIGLSENFYDERSPEMTRHFNLWGTGASPFAPRCVQWQMDTSAWRFQIDVLEYLLTVRPPIVFNQVQNQFGMINQVNVGLQTFPQGAGTIRLNTITPDSLPWTGIYFNGNPITMTAIPKPGYKFLYWESNHVLQTHYTDPTLRINVDSSDEFTAVFSSLESTFEAYPNPFYDDLTLYYEVTEASVVSLRVYDLTGRLVAEILPSGNFQQPGAYEIHVSAASLGLSNGMYLFQLTNSEFSKTIKLISSRPKQ